MMNEVMLSLDIETMDIGPEAAVLSIGARIFTKDGPTKGFEVFIDQNLAQQFGTLSMDTIKWWNKQDPLVYEKVFGGRLHPSDAVHQFMQFVAQHQPETVWANSPSFDCVILRHLFKQVNLTFPFHFTVERDFRTLFAIGRDINVDTRDCWEGMRAHMALDDATAQAKAGARILTKIYGPTLSAAAMQERLGDLADEKITVSTIAALEGLDSVPPSTGSASKSRGRASPPSETSK